MWIPTRKGIYRFIWFNAFYDASDPISQKVEDDLLDLEDTALRLLKGNITIEDLNNMSRRELMDRLDSRLRYLKKEDKKQAAARQFKEELEDNW